MIFSWPFPPITSWDEAFPQLEQCIVEHVHALYRVEVANTGGQGLSGRRTKRVLASLGNRLDRAAIFNPASVASAHNELLTPLPENPILPSQSTGEQTEGKPPGMDGAFPRQTQSQPELRPYEQTHGTSRSRSPLPRDGKQGGKTELEHALPVTDRDVQQVLCGEVSEQ